MVWTAIWRLLVDRSGGGMAWRLPVPTPPWDQRPVGGVTDMVNGGGTSLQFVTAPAGSWTYTGTVSAMGRRAKRTGSYFNNGGPKPCQF